MRRSTTHNVPATGKRRLRHKTSATFVVVIPVLLTLYITIPASCALPAEKGPIAIGSFSTRPDGSLPPGWEPMTFKKIPRHTHYDLVDKDGRTVVRATSTNGASGLICRKKIDPKEYPVLCWSWMATSIIQKGDIEKKSGDDYPARIYVAFEYDPEKAGLFEKTRFKVINLLYGEYPPAAAINYLWANHAPEGTIVPNAYTDRAQMIVVESGKEKLNTWVHEKRNVYDDYVKAFGEEPPMISGIAIMTDTDNTGESAVTYYGNITMFRKNSLD